MGDTPMTWKRGYQPTSVRIVSYFNNGYRSTNEYQLNINLGYAQHGLHEELAQQSGRKWTWSNATGFHEMIIDLLKTTSLRIKYLRPIHPHTNKGEDFGMVCRNLEAPPNLREAMGKCPVQACGWHKEAASRTAFKTWGKKLELESAAEAPSWKAQQLMGLVNPHPSR